MCKRDRGAAVQAGIFTGELTGNDPRLNGCTYSHYLIRIDRLTGVMGNQRPYELHHHGHPRAATHKHNIVNIFCKPA